VAAAAVAAAADAVAAGRDLVVVVVAVRVPVAAAAPGHRRAHLRVPDRRKGPARRAGLLRDQAAVAPVTYPTAEASTRAAA
jgi:hypothetical protein